MGTTATAIKSGTRRLGEHLLALKLVTENQLRQAIEIQMQAPAPLGSILVSLGYISEELLLNVLAAKMGVRPWHLEAVPPQVDALRKVSGDLCRTYQVLPVAVHGDVLVVAMRNPLDLDAIDLVRNVTSMKVEPVLASDERLMRAIEQAHGANQRNDKFDHFLGQALSEVQPDVQESKTHGLKNVEDTRPAVGLVNEILTEAICLHASDIHIEPRADRIDVRYRMDGEMQPVKELPLNLLPMLTARLKIMADLDIVEFRLPQDGRMGVQVDNRVVDLRVSVLPNHHGQRIVLRILDRSASLKKLDEIGFSDSNLKLYESLIRRPHGLILVTGPTGSGKTTTLYASLATLRTGRSNIMTCEDPIEYEIDGVNQSQVNEKVGLTFATQLRAILRQDPDTILVGEIRDQETAETAIRASLTGHLVLSTLHCNDAPSAIPRLLDMGINPYLLSTSLTGVTAQRLVRTLCPACRKRSKPTPLQAECFAEAGLNCPTEIFESGGCPKCRQSGFRGRMAVHELMPAFGEVASAIAAQAPHGHHARSRGPAWICPDVGRCAPSSGRGSHYPGRDSASGDTRTVRLS
jgi:type IV pilus assembly protein PilB